MDAMRRIPLAALALALGVGGGTLISACGSQTKTVSVAGAPPVTQTTATQSTTPKATATSPASTSTSATPAPSTTRSAPEPAFTQHEAPSEAASAASAVLRAKGFTANDPSEYHANQTLRVLIGTRSGSGDGYGQQAFFFVDGHYIGTDAKEPSAKIKVTSQSDTAVTIAYPLYRHNDPLCCATGGQASVTFQLNNGKLSPVGTIPPSSSTSGLSRY
jgi:hypothetical protein